MNRPKCPKCKSAMISIERRPYGNSTCMDCGLKLPTKNFYQPDRTDQEKSIGGDRMDIIKIELEAVREKVAHMFRMRNDELNRMVKSSLERYCTEGYLQEIIDLQVKEILHNATKVKVGGSYEASEIISNLIHKTVLEKLKKINDA